MKYISSICLLLFCSCVNVSPTLSTNELDEFLKQDGTYEDFLEMGYTRLKVDVLEVINTEGSFTKRVGFDNDNNAYIKFISLDYDHSMSIEDNIEVIKKRYNLNTCSPVLSSPESEGVLYIYLTTQYNALLTGFVDTSYKSDFRLIYYMPYEY